MSKEAFNEAIAYVRGLDEQDKNALTAADALAAAVAPMIENVSCGLVFRVPPGFWEKAAETLAEYRKIRPQSAPDGSETAKGD